MRGARSPQKGGAQSALTESLEHSARAALKAFTNRSRRGINPFRPPRVDTALLPPQPQGEQGTGEPPRQPAGPAAPAHKHRPPAPLAFLGPARTAPAPRTRGRSTGGRGHVTGERAGRGRPGGGAEGRGRRRIHHGVDAGEASAAEPPGQRWGRAAAGGAGSSRSAGRVRASVRACVTRREERRGGRNRPGRAEGVELPGSGAGEGRWRQGRAGPAPGWR